MVQLNPTPEQARLLQRTLHEHTACFNTVARLGFASKCSNGVELHKETYYPLRAAFPDLPAQLVCAARVKATEAVKSALTWAKKHEAAYPRHAGQYIGSKVCSTDLCLRKGRYFLHIVVSIAAPPVSPSQEVIGVDLGLNRPAVTSTRQFLGERRWKEQERRIFRLRRKLQKNGSKSATRHLKNLSGQLFRLRRDHDHVLSKRVVQHAMPGCTIVLENLTNIRERVTHKHGEGQRRMHCWSFAQFYAFLSYIVSDLRV
ncbi:MAG TPA: transposase [Ktedonobacteraceae bacterium]|nr:transposase [Ktedonobacteraceae bacterium]